MKRLAESLSLADARRVALHAQWFGRPRPSRDVTGTDLLRAVGAIGLVQIGLLAATGILVFGLRFAAAPLSFLPVFLLGTAAFAAAGFFLAGILATVESAVAVAQILAMLFMFTSGLFVPVELIPRPFADLTVVNPVWYFSRAVFSSLVLGRGPFELGPDLGALAAFFGVFLLLTVLTFRYERTA